MVLVYSDNKKLAFELLSKAADISKETKNEVIAAIIGKNDETYAKELVSYGADKVYIAENESETSKAEEYCEILENIITETKSEIILIGSNKNGKEIRLYYT